MQSDNEPSNNVQSAVVTLPEDRFGALSSMELEKPEKEICHYISAGVVRPLALPTDVLGTGDGTYSDNGVTPTVVETERVRQTPLPVSFENFEAMIRYLDELPGYQARIRPIKDSIAHIPLTKPRWTRQWSYLDSERKIKRAVVIADVIHKQQVYSLIEFQWRDGEAFKLALMSTPSGVRLSDELMSKLLYVLAKKNGRWENAKPLPADIRLATLKHTWPCVRAYADAVVSKITTISS